MEGKWLDSMENSAHGTVLLWRDQVQAPQYDLGSAVSVSRRVMVLSAVGIGRRMMVSETPVS
jgi:hypothetical protein